MRLPFSRLRPSGVSEWLTPRPRRTVRIDLQVMKDAGILLEVYAKSLLYRSPQLTNVMVQPYYGMYNYAVLGLK